MKAIMLSIHPEWAEKIYSGEKTVEWRKHIPSADFIDKVFLYETAPVCRVTGCFDYNFYYSLVFKHLGLSLCPTAKVFIDAGCVPIVYLVVYIGTHLCQASTFICLSFLAITLYLLAQVRHYLPYLARQFKAL